MHNSEDVLGRLPDTAPGFLPDTEEMLRCAMGSEPHAMEPTPKRRILGTEPNEEMEPPPKRRVMGKISSASLMHYQAYLKNSNGGKRGPAEYARLLKTKKHDKAEKVTAAAAKAKAKAASAKGKTKVWCRL